MTPRRLEVLRRWCNDPRSQDEYGYDVARELLDEVDRLRGLLIQERYRPYSSKSDSSHVKQ